MAKWGHAGPQARELPSPPSTPWTGLQPGPRPGVGGSGGGSGGGSACPLRRKKEGTRVPGLGGPLGRLGLSPAPPPPTAPQLHPRPRSLGLRPSPFLPRPVPDFGERGRLRGHAGSEGALGRAGRDRQRRRWRRQHTRPAFGGWRPRRAPSAAAQEPAVGPEAEPQEPKAGGEGGGRVDQPAAAQPVPALRAAGAVGAGQEPHEAPGAAHHRLR